MAQALEENLQAGERVQQILVAPRIPLVGRQRSWRQRLRALLPWQWQPAWVLASTDRRVLAVSRETASGVMATYSIDPAATVWLELGSILLSSWFTFALHDSDRVAAAAVYFNTVGVAHFRRLVFRLAQDMADEADLPDFQHDRNLGALDGLPFKFRNVTAHRFLLPSERVDAVAFRPAGGLQPHLPWRQPRTPGLAAVLTNYHLLIAEEDEAPAIRSASYGMIARYLPLSRLQDVRVDADGRDLWLSLQVGLGNVTDTQRLRFPAAAAADLAQLAERAALYTASSSMTAPSMAAADTRI